MIEFKNYINSHFELSDLSPNESSIASKYHLRFELGDNLENGTLTRVKQSTERAIKIFHEFFKQTDEIWVFIKSWESCSQAEEFYPSTEGYLENQFINFNSIKIIQNQEKVEEFDEIENKNGVLEMTDLSILHKQKVFKTKVSQINYTNIFQGIANSEMGFSPSISEYIYFVNPRNNTVFYMYDDRGCLLFSYLPETLKNTYLKYNEWLVNYHRKDFDKMYKN